MFFPISDDDRQILTPMYVTYFLLAVNILVFIYQLSNPDFTYGWSIVPKEITTGQDLVNQVPIPRPGDRIPVEQEFVIPQRPGPSFIWLTLVTAMFMHGGLGHLGGNMLYLWIFGDNVEHRFGAIPFLCFYLLAGLVGSLAQIMLDPSGLMPNLGASGAIAGVMGAYLVLFPYNRVNVIVFYMIITVPAVLVLGMWIAMQLVSQYGAMFATETTTGGVAYMAHIGGFVTGVVAGLAYRSMIHVEPDSVLHRQYDRDPQARRIW